MVTQVTKTIDDLVAEARTLLNDSTVPYRFSNEILLRSFNTALREIYRYRPDAYVGNFTSGALSRNLVNTYDETDLGTIPTLTAFPLDDRMFYSPVLYYTVGLTELSDDEFTDDNRAMTLLTAFRTTLVGVGG